jgi:four helix bundle protein
MANIAEGFDRYGQAEFHRFLGIAKSSCVELETLLQISVDVGYLDSSHHEALTARTQSLARSIGKLMTRLRAPPSRP